MEQAEGKKFLDEVTGEMVSKTELKKRTKLRENEKKKAEKEAKKAAEKAAQPKKEKKVLAGGDDDLDPTKYTENRKAMVEAERQAGNNPYPHKFNRSHRVDEFRA